MTFSLRANSSTNRTMETEVICISSDDESNLEKENKKDKSLTDPTKVDDFSVGETKTEILFNDQKIEVNNLKRKISQISEKTCSPPNIVEKKQKLNTFQDILKVPQNNFTVSIANSLDLKKDQDVTHNKPKLIVKERRKISYVSQDVFPIFISLCLQQCHVNDKDDMKKIIVKLKRRYEELNPDYANSEKFVLFLNEKRDAIINNDKKLYVYIEEVMNEMKRNVRRQVRSNNEVYDAVPSTSYANSSINKVKSDDEFDENVDHTASRKTDKITQILTAMEKCKQKICKLEVEEVDFNDESDSNYIKVERYKQRMIELYIKLCELNGENIDAGRAYLRPKHISATGILALDQAITNFINSKISKRNQLKKSGALAKNLIFPDYRDILECINRCNDKRNLDLDKKKQELLAKNAFTQLGEYLQRARRDDYWDTFGLYLENAEEDPALKDKELENKLAQNQVEGKKRLSAIFEEYSKKQEEIKEQDFENYTNSEIATEEEGEDESDTDSDILSIDLSSEDDKKEDINEVIKENILPVETKNETNTCTINVNKDEDKKISNNVEDKKISNKDEDQKISNKDEDILKVRCNEKVEIKIHFPAKENSATVMESENNTISTTASTSKKTTGTDVNTHKDSLQELATNCTNIVVDRTGENVAECVPQAITKCVTDDVETNCGVEILMESVKKKANGEVKEDIMEVISESTLNIVTDKTTKTSNVSEHSDKQTKEDQKPKLRVCSFAKTPNAWKDVWQKTSDTVKKSAHKVSNQSKDIIDLTNESNVYESAPVVAKCTLKFGRRMVSLVKAKSQSSTVPSGSNIINNPLFSTNYFKLNMRKGKLVPMRSFQGPIIRMSPAQVTTTRQNQPQDTNVVTSTKNGLLYKKNGTIVKLIQPKKFCVKKITQSGVSNNVHINPLKPSK